MNIAELLRHKVAAGSPNERPPVATISADDTVATLVADLARHNVGALVVADGDRVTGIASERDVVRRLATDGAELLQRAVSSIMTTTVASCASDDTVDSVAASMTERRIRHMPVIDDGRLTGIVSIGDVVSSRISQLEHDRGQLEQYISS